MTLDRLRKNHMAAAAMVVAFCFSVSCWAAIIGAYYAYRSVTRKGEQHLSFSDCIVFTAVLVAVVGLGSLLSNYSAYSEGLRIGFTNQ